MAPPQPPIRVALVGLSSNAATGWASNAHRPYLQSAAAARARFEIVVCTRIDKHFSAALAAARGAKDVFVEWSLADNLEHARELARAAREAHVRSVVGLQVSWWW
jgi:predicted dehydrogenase